MGIAGFLNTIAILFVFSAILFLAYVVSKYVGSKASKMMQGQNIRVVETISMGMDKQLHLVKVGDQFILLATSGKNITMLTEVKPDDIGEVSIEKVESLGLDGFKQYFEKYSDLLNQKLKGVVKNHNAVAHNHTAEKPKKASTRSNLERLKEMNHQLKINSKHGGDENSYDIHQTEENRK